MNNTNFIYKNLTVFSCFWLLLSYSPTFSQSSFQRTKNQRIIVKFKEVGALKKSSLKGQLSIKNARSLKRLNLDVWEVGNLLKGNNKSFNTQEEFLKYLNNRPEIEYAEPDYPVYITDTEPNDPEFPQQWALRNTGQNACSPGISTNAAKVWDQRSNCSEVVVGVIDTGIDWKHEDLVNNIWQNLEEDADGDGTTLEWNGREWILDPGDLNGLDEDGNGYSDDLIGWDFVNDDNNPYDDEGHGTHVAGIIGAEGNNGIGVTGLCWDVQLMAMKGLDQEGSGNISSLLKALEYALAKGVKISNNSWSSLGNYSQALYQAIKRAGEEQDHLFVAAAGNNGSDNDTYSVYPASYDLPNVLSIAASNCKDKLIAQSNYGVQSVDLFAPGEEIHSTLPGNRYGLKSGTSMAAPFVAGAAALIAAEFPDLNYEAVKDKITLNLREAPGLVGRCRFNGALEVNNAFEGGYLFENDEDPWLDIGSGPRLVGAIEYKEYIWISREGGDLIRVEKGNSEITHFNAENSNLPVNSIRDMAVGNDRLWLATNGGGVVSYDGGNFHTNIFFIDSAQHRIAEEIVFDQKNQIWARAGGMITFKDSIWENVSSLQPDPSDLNGPYHLTVDSLNNIWGVFNGELWMYDRVDLKWTDMDRTLPTDSTIVSVIKVHPSGDVWVGTTEDGIIIFSHRTNEIKSLTRAPHFVKDIFFLNDSITWVIPFNDQEVIEFNNQELKRLFYINGRTYNDYIHGLVDSQGRIWTIHSSGPTIQIFDGINWEILDLNIGPQIQINPFPRKFLKKDPFGNIWTNFKSGISVFRNDEWEYFEGSYFEGIEDIDFKGLDTTWMIKEDELILCQNGISCSTIEGHVSYEKLSLKNVLVTQKGDIWLTSHVYISKPPGLFKYDGTWTHFDTTLSPDLPSNMISTLFEDERGILWIGTDEGLVAFDEENEFWTPHPISETLYPNRPFPDEALKSLVIFDIEQDSKKQIWIIVNGRFLFFNGDNWTLPEWELEELVFEFEVDHDDNIWAIGSEWNLDHAGHLFKIQPSGRVIKWDQFNSPISSWELEKLEIDQFGQLWFSTDNGIHVINPDELTSFSVESFNACIGEEKFFENQTAVADSFRWIINQEFVSKKRDLTHTFTSTGTYEVALLSYGGGEADTFISHIQVRALPNVGLGKDTTTCTRGVYLDPGDPSLAYAWTDLTGDTLSTDQGFIAKSTGTYIVTGTDVCGIVDKDTILVTLTTDPAGSCVRPGDINGNGLVNMIDLLVLGSAHDELGKKRPNPSGEWKDQPSPDWGREFTHSSAIGLDLKHGDSDGDGEIVIHKDASYIFEHAQGSHPPGITSANLANRLRVKPQRPRYFLGDTITFDVFLENAARKKVENAYGVAFSMEHNLQLSQAPVLRLHDSWLGNERDDLYGGFIKYPRHMDFGITRYNQQPKSDSGKIAEIEIIILAEDIDTTRYTRRLNFSVKALNTVLMDASGEQLPVDAINVNTLETVALEMPWVRVELKAILPGAYDPEKREMHTMLNEQGLLPHIPPFPDVYQPEFASFPDDVVDWVWIQLRDKENPHHVIAQRVAWLGKTGKVIDPEGEGSLVFMSPPGKYYIALKHRNHLEAISHRLVDLDTTQNDLANVYDFTTNPHLLLLNTPGEDPVYGLFPGDINQDGRIQYSGPGNDRREILLEDGNRRSNSGINRLFS